MSSSSNPQQIPAGLSSEAVEALNYERASRTASSGNDDPFYVLPPLPYPLPSPGTILRLESVTNTPDYTIPPNTALSRFIYVSETLNGTLVPVSAFILWPFTGRTSANAWGARSDKRDGYSQAGEFRDDEYENVGDERGVKETQCDEKTKFSRKSKRKKKNSDYQNVAWAHGTSGISSTCAPSRYRNLWQHFLAPYQLVLSGYIVIATDYAGLGVSSFSYTTNNTHQPISQPTHPIPIAHEYISNPSAANDVIYSITAAHTAFPILSQNYVVAGHSQGGGAAWSVAQREVNSPTLGYLGSIAISPVTSFLDMNTFEAESFGVPAGPGIASIFGTADAVKIDTHSKQFYSNLNLTPEYGDFELGDVFQDPALQAFKTLNEIQGCNAVADYLFISPLTNGTALAPNWQLNSYYQLFQNLTANGGKPIAGPMLVIHGEADTTINITMTENAIEKTMPFLTEIGDTTLAAAPSIEFLKMPGSDHTPTLTGSQVLWMQWIEDRFDGVAMDLDYFGDGAGWTGKGERVSYREESVQTVREEERAYQGELNWVLGLATEAYETA